MTSSDHRPFRTALIPWVIALVALFGLNALAPIFSITKKSECPEGVGLSQLADDGQIPGRVTSPLVYLDPPAADGTRFHGIAWVLRRIETRRDHPVAQALGGAIRGRAPPEKALV